MKQIIIEIPKKINRLIKEIEPFYHGDAIFVYQMGKVGSSSIEKSLTAIGEEVVHFHSLRDYHLWFVNTTHIMQSKLRQKIRMKVLFFLCIYFLKHNKKTIKIISLTREPISRNISAMFQDMHSFIYEYMVDDCRKQENINDMLNNVFDNYIDHRWPICWFDDELKFCLGLDVYQYEFPKDKGWMVIKERNIELLLIRMENLNQCEAVIGEFLNLDNFKLVNENESKNKWYSEISDKFKHNFRPKQEYIDFLYNSKYMTHFYSEAEISSFREKWSKKE